MKRLSALLLFVACAAYAKPDSLNGVDAEIQRAMVQLHVPGAAVGVIRDGKVVLARGYGVRELGRPERVDAETVFSLASISKSFTTAVMATLVDEGKLDWDKPVRDYLPGFEMFDPVTTQLMTPRDLASHRSGLPRHDFLRFSTYLQPAELVRRLRYLPPSRTFRDGFQYNNLMFAAAGYLAGEVAGSNWNALVETRIFEPVGMTRSNTSPVDSAHDANHATGHRVDNGKVAPIEFYQYGKFGVAPAGAVASSINDMLKYLGMYLNAGRAGDRQVISAAQVQELWRGVTVDGNNSYALGWERTQRHERLLMQHGGSIDGFTAQIMLFPDQKIGIVVLNNQGSSLPRLVGNYLADRLLGAPNPRIAPPPGRSWEEDPPPAQVTGTRPSLPLSAYAGDYFHPAYGVIHIVVRGPELVLQFDAAEISLVHHHYDTFHSAGFRGMGMGLYQFRLNTAGHVAELSAPLESAVAPLVLVRQESIQ